MSGFDNGTQQGGIFFQAKQFGAILRGFGPPVPQAGIVGDLYIDVQTWQLFEKRATDGTVDPWGHYLFIVPLAYRTTLKWFSAAPPDNGLGIAGDYCLAWAGWANYGLEMTVYGPKQATSWPENGEGPSIAIAAPGTTVLPIGLVAPDGAPIPYSSSTQLIGVGLLDEYILAVPVTADAGDPITQLGLQSGAALVDVVVNPLYTAEDQHLV